MNDHSASGMTRNDNTGYLTELVSYTGSKLLKINSYLREFYHYLTISLDTTTHRYWPPKDVVVTQFLFYLTSYVVLCYFTYIIRVVFRNRMSHSKYFETRAERILLVTAHPDDECMFFGPLIMQMLRKRKCLYLLCLCNGEAHRAQMHKKELFSSCRTLGIKPENVFLCVCPLRVEGGALWVAENIASLVRDYVEILDIDTLVTFDKYGVTGDMNHIATFRAVSYLNLRRQLPVNCHIFLLDSLGFVRKYSSVMDAVLSLFMSENVFVLPPDEHRVVRRALNMHYSQLRLYRRLYIMFSRYTHVNSLSELPRYLGSNFIPPNVGRLSY